MGSTDAYALTIEQAADLAALLQQAVDASRDAASYGYPSDVTLEVTGYGDTATLAVHADGQSGPIGQVEARITDG